LKQVVLETGKTLIVMASPGSGRRFADHCRPGLLRLTLFGRLKTICLFLSRYFYPTALLDQLGKRMDLETLLRKQTGNCKDVQVKLGCRAQHQIPCRLIILRNPDAVTEKRRRRAKAHAKKRGTTLSQTYLFMLGWTLFVTNAPDTMISLKQVYDFYRIRWQIELIFKLWKSYCGLNQILTWRKERVLTELYAKMLGIVLLHFLLAPLRIPDQVGLGREISAVQVRKRLARFAMRFPLCLSDPTALVAILRQLFAQIEQFGFKQKRRKKPNVCQLLAEPLA
jgi:hypothetical protein